MTNSRVNVACSVCNYTASPITLHFSEGGAFVSGAYVSYTGEKIRTGRRNC